MVAERDRYAVAPDRRAVAIVAIGTERPRRIGADPERRRGTDAGERRRRLLVAQHEQVDAADEPARESTSEAAAQVARADTDEGDVAACRLRRRREQAGVAQQRGRTA